MQKLAIYGSDGFAREILPMVRTGKNYGSDIVFVDDVESKWGQSQNGSLILGFDEAVHQGRHFCIAIANSEVRRRLAARIMEAGAAFFSATAGSVIMYDDIKIGEGGILCANSILTSNIQIGKHFHANIYSYVAHDCVVGDYVTFAPRVSCNGRVVIEDDVYVGTSAILRQGSHDKPLTIGKGAVIGMGAVVTKDVAAGSTVIGNPARPMETKT